MRFRSSVIETEIGEASDATELQCVSPRVDFVAPVRIEVSINGQQFSTGGPVFTFEDNWHAPAQSGVLPSERHGMASALVGSVAYYFGGEDASFLASGEGFVNDFWALHLDAMSDFYPSDSARDLAWQKLSLSTSGDPPTPRSYASLVAWATTLILFGGTSSVWADMHNSTYEYSTTRRVWQQVAVAGGPVAPRSGHTATLCSLSVNCRTSDGRPRMFVFGGWGLRDCGHHKQCLRHRDDLWALDLTASPMAWTEVAVNAEQPRPHARKEHSSAIVNGSTLVVFGPLPPVPNKPAPAARPALPAFSVPSASLPGRRALPPLPPTARDRLFPMPRRLGLRAGRRRVQLVRLDDEAGQRRVADRPERRRRLHVAPGVPRAASSRWPPKCPRAHLMRSRHPARAVTRPRPRPAPATRCTRWETGRRRARGRRRRCWTGDTW